MRLDGIYICKLVSSTGKRGSCKQNNLLIATHLIIIYQPILMSYINMKVHDYAIHGKVNYMLYMNMWHLLCCDVVNTI